MLPTSADLPEAQAQAAQPAVRPEAALQPVAAPQPAVRPETALQPVAAPVAGRTTQQGQGPLQLQANYCIDGATDVDAALRATEESTLRLVRQIA